MIAPTQVPVFIDGQSAKCEFPDTHDTTLHDNMQGRFSNHIDQMKAIPEHFNILKYHYIY